MVFFNFYCQNFVRSKWLKNSSSFPVGILTVNPLTKFCWLCLLSQSILLKDSQYVAPMHVLHVILVFNLHCLTLSTINDVFFFLSTWSSSGFVVAISTQKTSNYFQHPVGTFNDITEESHRKLAIGEAFYYILLLLKTGSEKIIYWLSRYSFHLGFIMSKNPKGLWYYILIKSSVSNLSLFFDMIKPKRKDHLPTQ